MGETKGEERDTYRRDMKEIIKLEVKKRVERKRDSCEDGRTDSA
jgi:hypothetical protein